MVQHKKSGFVNKNRAFLCGVTVLFSSNALSESLMEVYQLALANDAIFQAAQYKKSGIEENVTQAISGMLPDVALRVQRSDLKQNIHSSEFESQKGREDIPVENRSVTISQPLFNYPSWVRYKQANTAVNQAETEYRVAQQELIISVSEAYFTALAAQDRLEFTRIEKAAIEKQLRDIKVKNKTGAARISDVHDVKARYALSESKEIEMLNALDDSNQALREHTRVFVLKVLPIDEHFPLLPPEPSDMKVWIEEAFTGNLSLEASRQALEVARQEAKFHEVSHYPTLDLVLSDTRRIVEGKLTGDTEGVTDTTSAMLQLNFQLYQGGRVQSRMRQAYLNREKAAREMEAKKRRIERETRAAFRGMLSGIQKVKALKQSIISQKSALKVKTRGLKAGVNTLLQVLDAQRELYYAQTNHSQARYDYLLSYLKLRQVTGSLNQSHVQEIQQYIM